MVVIGNANGLQNWMKKHCICITTEQAKIILKYYNSRRQSLCIQNDRLIVLDLLTGMEYADSVDRLLQQALNRCELEIQSVYADVLSRNCHKTMRLQKMIKEKNALQCAYKRALAV